MALPDKYKTISQRLIDNRRAEEAAAAEAAAKEEEERRKKQQESLKQAQMIEAANKAAAQTKAAEIAEKAQNTFANPPSTLAAQTDFTDYLKNLQSLTDQSVSAYKSGAVNNTALPISDTAKDLMARYAASSNTLSSRDADYWNRLTQYEGDVKGDFGKLTDYITNDEFYNSPVYEKIMANYMLQGNKSAGNAVADSAASNSGNLDSFAAANALRQQKAFTQAGDESALNMYNSKIGNWNNTLLGKASAMDALQGRMQSNIDNARLNDQSLLSYYNDLMKTQSASDMAQNAALSTAISNAQSSIMDKYITDIKAYNDRYNTDVSTNLAMYGTADTETATIPQLREMLEDLMRTGTSQTGGALSYEQAIAYLKMLYPGSEKLIDIMISGDEDSANEF